ncbi:hypothetical protein CBS101457_004965 [Exobasidium rhododendri]|nr:hypothetical protein CBS101457_004965 [Exobasidium rhododendri]
MTASPSSTASPTTVACLSCRSRKIRCERSDATAEKCKRCIATGSPCFFRVHHRGKTIDGRVDLRKTRKRKQSDVGNHQQQQQQQQPHPQDADRSSNSSRGTQDSSFHPPHSRASTSQLDHDLPPPRSSSSISDSASVAPPRYAHSSPITPRPRPTQDLQDGFMNTEALEDPDAAFQASLRITQDYPNVVRDRIQVEYDADRQAEVVGIELNEISREKISFNIASNIRSDALANGVISWDRLETIFNWYMRRVDPRAGLLDPDLHTASYTRQHYPLLFSAVTTMSAMARRDAEYPSMIKIHEGLDAFATLSDYNCLDSVQAKIAMLIWGIGEGKTIKAGRTRLHRIHQIVTDAIDLSLHINPNNDCTGEGSIEDETRWREQASRRRTWIQLCLIYQTHQSDVTLHSDQLLGHRIPTAETFLSQCGAKTATIADYRLAASLEIMAIRCDIMQSARILQPLASSPSPHLSKAVGNDLASLHERLSGVFKRLFIVDGNDVYPRGKLDMLTAHDIHFLVLSTRFYLYQVTWLWASCATNNGSSPPRLPPLQAPRNDGRDQSERESVVGGKRTKSVSDMPRASSLLVHPSSDKEGLSADEEYWFEQSQVAALQILTMLVNMEDEGVMLSQDFAYVSASKVSLWLSRYNEWFSPSFLQDTRRVMVSLLQRCRAAASRRGNTLRCFARLMDAILQCLPSSPATGDRFQHTGQQDQPPPSTISVALSSCHLPRETHSAPIPNMSIEAEVGAFLPLRGSAAKSEQASTTQPVWQVQHFQQQQPVHLRDQQSMLKPSTDASMPVSSLDLGHFLDVEDLRHWEELLGLDLQLGRVSDGLQR